LRVHPPRITFFNRLLEGRTEYYQPRPARGPSPGAGRNGGHEGGTEGPAFAEALHLTDMGNAVRLVRLHGRDLRHCHPWGKDLVWDGRRWLEDDTARIEQFAKETVRQIYQEAAATPDDDRRAALVRHAVRSESARAITAMIRLARSEPGIPVLPAELDRDRWVLNCPNGTVDLRTGKLREHRREDLITQLCNTAYDPLAVCPLWLRTLDTILGGKQELVGYLQRLLGYCLTGDVSEQILVIFWGRGSNGKTTIIGVILDLLGPGYAGKGSRDLFLAVKNDTHPTVLADLFGKRLVVCTEAPEGSRLDEGLVKELTGGDPLKARRMHEDLWQFFPTHKALLAVNHKPEIRGTDHGIWRRQRLVPFTAQFWNPDKGETGPPELRADKTIPERLRAEYPGILAWMVRGCLEWQRQGLGTPEEVLRATEDYRNEQDLIGTFLEECCLQGRDYRCRAGKLYESFHNWCERNGEGYGMRQRRFGEAMSERGFVREVSNGTWYRGVALQND
jgi:putative DNA primase/helicase